MVLARKPACPGILLCLIRGGIKTTWIALAVALLLHLGIVVVLFWVVLPAIRLEERGGILVNIGDVAFAQRSLFCHALRATTDTF